MVDAAAAIHGSDDGTSHTPGRDDQQVMDLLNASGVLNPNTRLDTLMDVSRQLAELEPGITGFATQAFYGSWYVYKQIVR